MKKEALIVVDYQNDFAHPDGSLYVKGWENLVAYINTVMKDIKEKSWLIITSQDWHPKDHVSFASSQWVTPFSLVWNEVKWPDHCVADTWGADFLAWFQTDLVDRKVLKGTSKEIDSYSSFGWVEASTSLPLDTILKSFNIQTLTIVWLATEYCDLATVQDALKLWYEVNVLRKWIAAVNVNPDDGEKALEKMMSMWAKILT